MKYSEFKQQVQSLKGVTLNSNKDKFENDVVELYCRETSLVKSIKPILTLDLNTPQLIIETHYDQAHHMDLQEFIMLLQYVARLQATPIDKRIDKEKKIDYYLIDTDSNSSIQEYSIKTHDDQVELKVKYVVGADSYKIAPNSLLSFLLSEQPGVIKLLTHCKVVKKVKVGNDIKDAITYNLDSDIDEQTLIQKLLKEWTVTSIDTETKD